MRRHIWKCLNLPISMSCRELYQSLFDTHVVSPFYLKPI
ncbi:hypothetical protein Gotur_026275, partial [Gossypium turneri]